MTEPTCGFCGLVDKRRCRSADEAEDCRHAPVEGKGPVIRTGPLKGLRRGRYRAIMADPPWSFKTYSNRDQGTVPHRGAEPYKSMTHEDLLAMPVSEIAANDCLLHMWVISSHVDQALALGAAWGFTFKSLGFNWVKTQKHSPEKPKMGMGKWLRQDAEIGLLFARGKPKRAYAGVSQTILEPAREHSRKPDTAMDRFEQLVDGPYVELFSRSTRTGWDSMGDQKGLFDKVEPLDAEALSLL